MGTVMKICILYIHSVEMVGTEYIANQLKMENMNKYQ